MHVLPRLFGENMLCWCVNAVSTILMYVVLFSNIIVLCFIIVDVMQYSVQFLTPLI